MFRCKKSNLQSTSINNFILYVFQYLIRITETTKTNTKLAVFKYKQISAHSEDNIFHSVSK